MRGLLMRPRNDWFGQARSGSVSWLFVLVERGGRSAGREVCLLFVAPSSQLTFSCRSKL